MNWHTVPRRVREVFDWKLEREREHFQKFGFHRRHLSGGVEGDRIVQRGSELIHWKGKGSFINFLEQDILFRIGDAVEEFEDHPLRLWLDELRRQVRERRKADPTTKVLSTVAKMNFFTVAYDLFVVSDNTKLRERLVKSLKVPDQFHGAKFELLVSACLLRAGYEVQFSDEENLKVNHPDAFVRHLRTGVEYDVEMKAKGRSGVLGKPGKIIEPDELNRDVSRQWRKALSKPSDRERLIFIDMNLPSTIEGKHDAEMWWVKEAIASAKSVETNPGKVPAETSAFVIFMNSPSSFLPSEDIYEGLETAYGAYNKADFNKDLRNLGDRSSDIADLFEAFLQHSDIPQEF